MAGSSDSSTAVVVGMLREDFKSVREAVSDMNRELGEVGSCVSGIQENVKQHSVTIQKIRDDQLSCPGRTGVGGTNARLHKIERRLDEEVTGQIDVSNTIPKNSDSPRWFTLVRFVFPILGALALGGVGVGMLFMSLLGGN